MTYFDYAHDHPAKVAVDMTSLATVVGSLIGWLPSIAALLSIVWSLIRIYETQTVQGWIKRLKG